ncbi:MAG: hypothetical protein AAF933_15220, partial [Pseudomonadota bacterium]
MTRITSQSPGQPSPTVVGAHEFIDVPGNAASREYFEPLGTAPGSGQPINGSAAAETLSGAVAAGGSGLPGALSFYSFANEAGGSFADLRGGPSV